MQKNDFLKDVVDKSLYKILSADRVEYLRKSIDESTGCTYIRRLENIDWRTSTSIALEPSESFSVSTSIDKSIDTVKDTKLNTETKDNRPIHLYFNRNMPEKYYEPDTVHFFTDTLTNKIIYCKDWSELSENMKLNPHSICFNASELEHGSTIEIVNMVNTLSKLVGVNHDIVITVGISKDTNYSVIKDLQKSNIFGIVPAHIDFGEEETVRALNAQWNKIPYWPKHIIEKLPGAKKTSTKKTDIKLTPRQEQVLHLIQERGASNKVIANILNISESTVKLHVACVLKKFNVRNRTQLAVFGKK